LAAPVYVCKSLGKQDTAAFPLTRGINQRRMPNMRAWPLRGRKLMVRLSKIEGDALRASYLPLGVGPNLPGCFPSFNRLRLHRARCNTYYGAFKLYGRLERYRVNGLTARISTRMVPDSGSISMLKHAAAR
jgi:hypothetical protein